MIFCHTLNWQKSKLVPNNVSFINFIKIKAAIPHPWETNSNTYCQEEMPLSVEDLHEIHFPKGWNTQSAYQSLSTAKNAVAAETTEQLAKGLWSYNNRKRLEGGFQD